MTSPRTLRNFIGGTYVDGSAGATSDVVDPTTGQVVAHAPVSGAEEVDAAYEAAGLETIRRIDLDSTLLQGVGWVEGNSLCCSSFAGNKPYPLGPQDRQALHSGPGNRLGHQPDRGKRRGLIP